jgi:hypothetical protein
MAFIFSHGFLVIKDSLLDSIIFMSSNTEHSTILTSFSEWISSSVIVVDVYDTLWFFVYVWKTEQSSIYIFYDMTHFMIIVILLRSTYFRGDAE